VTPLDPARLRLFHDVWREVSRHLELGDALPDLWRLVQPALGGEGLIVRRFLADKDRLDTLASVHRGRAPDLPSRTPLGPADVEALRTWASRREASRHAGATTGLAAVLAPQGLAGPFAAGPLFEGRELAGVAIALGDLRDRLDSFERLLEPLGVALQNDHRVHELAVLREAAEADKRALLSRLQRQDISDTIVGADQGLRAVMERVEQVARTDAPVLLVGETGSGKEVVARAIHTKSTRSSGPFLRVNCGAIPPELVDSELFGHEKGAFTGAVGTRKGWFERADGGTLFLDELGELPAAAQVRLLRVLQDGTFQRVGGAQTLTCDVRIVAATHRDLHKLVREGTFRQDLWYRIHVFPIDLPPLRDRQDDIPALAAFFAERAGQRLFGRPIVPTADDVARLRAYPWPGNVRELAAVLERAAILGDGRTLDVRAALGVQPADVATTATATDPDGIEDALRRCHGRIEGPFGAAAALGVNPHTLRSRMRKLGIDWSQFRRG